MANQDLYPPTSAYENNKENDKLPTYSEYIANEEKYQTNSFNAESIENLQDYRTSFSLIDEESVQPPKYETLYKRQKLKKNLE